MMCFKTLLNYFANKREHMCTGYSPFSLTQEECYSMLGSLLGRPVLNAKSTRRQIHSGVNWHTRILLAKSNQTYSSHGK